VLVVAGAVERVASALGGPARGAWATAGLAAGAIGAIFVATYSNMLQIHAYYTWSRPVYAAATELDRTLDPDCLIVMGHLDPSVLYTIGRKGWEEDPLLWDVHDMTSAVAKGACYYVAVELPRLRANRPLYAFLQKYKRVPVASGWQVYDLRHFVKRHFPKRPTGSAKGTASATAKVPGPSTTRSSPAPGTR